MKALPLILAASLLANAALVTTVAVRSSGKAGTSGSGSGFSLKHTPGSTGADISGRDLVAALNADDPAALRDILRAAGMSDEMVRSLVQMRIWKRYEARFKALQPKPDTDPNKPWWKDDPRQNNWYGNMTKAQREEMRQIQKEQRDEAERILGPDKNGNRGGWQDPRLGFLPPEKRQQLQQVQQDYQELIGEVQQDMQGFALPSDREKLRYLQEQQKQDIDALMTPAEREAYDLRMSQTAQQLRWQMTKFDATEEEYMKIFPLQKEFDAKYNTNDPYGGYVERDQKFWQERQAAEKQLKEQIKDVIGTERYTDYLRSQDGDYQQLQAATRRLDLPADTPAKVYSLRDDVSAGAQQIADNANLSDEQKKQALAELADSTRDRVRAALGTEAAEAFLKNRMSWLKVLEKGNVVTFNQDNTSWNSRPASKPAPKKK